MKYEARRSLIIRSRRIFEKETKFLLLYHGGPIGTVHIIKVTRFSWVFLTNQAIHRCLSIARRTVSIVAQAASVGLV
jgi:hypothetical protein